MYGSHRVELDNKAGTGIDGWDNLLCIDKLSYFLSPPVHNALWAHMHRFLSVRPSVCQCTIFMYTAQIGAIAVTGRAHCNVKLHFLSC